MAKRRQPVCLSAALAIVGLLACGDTAPVVVTDSVTTPSSDSALNERLIEVHDQLEAGDWRMYLTLRAEAAAGLHGDGLQAALGDTSPVVARTAAVVLEERLRAGEEPATLDAAASLALQATLSDQQTPTLVPLAIRILGRRARGASQAALLAALDGTTQGTARQMLLAALGDNADAGGVSELQARFTGLQHCAEIRHATLAIRRADDALSTSDGSAWLAESAAPRVLACADEAMEAGENPEPELLALVAAYEQSSAATIVEEVLLGDVSRALKLRALAMLLVSGDPSVGTVLNASIKELAAQGLVTEASRVIQALRGL